MTQRSNSYNYSLHDRCHNRYMLYYNYACGCFSVIWWMRAKTLYILQVNCSLTLVMPPFSRLKVNLLCWGGGPSQEGYLQLLWPFYAMLNYDSWYQSCCWSYITPDYKWLIDSQLTIPFIELLHRCSLHGFRCDLGCDLKCDLQMWFLMIKVVGLFVTFAKTWHRPRCGSCTRYAKLHPIRDPWYAKHGYRTVAVVTWMKNSENAPMSVLQTCCTNIGGENHTFRTAI